jgi:hypothetical protein
MLAPVVTARSQSRKCLIIDVAGFCLAATAAQLDDVPAASLAGPLLM